MNADPGRIRRALLSVHDKTGLVVLGRALAAAGVELLASGGTARGLEAAGVRVTSVEEFTGEPEILGGRVKTLHPRIYAGLLSDRREPDHEAALERAGYDPIDLVVCNLYPFARGVAEGRSRAEVIELIDIGGPALLRAAAKNVDGGVAVVVDPADYERVAAAASAGEIDHALRLQLALKAFRVVAEYDARIAEWFGACAGSPEAPEVPEAFPPRIGGFVRGPVLRYGENPHQRAFLYSDEGASGGAALGVRLRGKELSYNNYLDLDMALCAVFYLPEPACAVIKHTSPCGLASAASQPLALRQALAGDPVSAFGSVLGFNRQLEAATAEALLHSKTFVECIVAPGFTQEAIAMLGVKESLRLVAVPAADPTPRTRLHCIGGGLLLQDTDPGVFGPHGDSGQGASGWRVVTRRALEPGWDDELRFAMHAAFILKSNAIAVTKERTLLGAGAGHMSRVDAAAQALAKAGARSSGAFLASDAFFPFPDCVELAASAGIAAIIQPGGSLRDGESIAACDRHGLAMVFTGRRHFRH